MAAPATLWAFEGNWSIERVIEDHLGGPAGQFAGEAAFRRAGQRLLYREEGTLRLGSSAPMVATRSYIWRQERGWLQVDFDDGRPFHAVPLSVEDPEATHLCDPDRYEVNYDFTTWPTWSASWRVTGPRKDYTMTSRYDRHA